MIKIPPNWYIFCHLFIKCILRKNVFSNDRDASLTLYKMHTAKKYLVK